jgi:thiaminase/transcriptional activator TenA
MKQAYADWIETYGGDDYQQVCRDVGSLIDNAVLRRLGEQPTKSPRWAVLCKQFCLQRQGLRLDFGKWGLTGDRQQGKIGTDATHRGRGH